MQYIIRLIGLFQSISVFVILGCKKMKIFDKTARLGVSKSQGTQNTESTNQRWFKKISVCQKIISEV